LEKPVFSKIANILQKKFGNQFGSKNPVFWSKTGVSEYSELTEYSEFVLFRIFQKLQKNREKLVPIRILTEYLSPIGYAGPYWRERAGYEPERKRS